MEFNKFIGDVTGQNQAFATVLVLINFIDDFLNAISLFIAKLFQRRLFCGNETNLSLNDYGNEIFKNIFICFKLCNISTFKFLVQ